MPPHVFGLEDDQILILGLSVHVRDSGAKDAWWRGECGTWDKKSQQAQILRWCTVSQFASKWVRCIHFQIRILEIILLQATDLVKCDLKYSYPCWTCGRNKRSNSFTGIYCIKWDHQLARHVTVNQTCLRVHREIVLALSDSIHQPGTVSVCRIISIPGCHLHYGCPCETEVTGGKLLI